MLYSSPALYAALMRLVYRGGFADRYRSLAEWIPSGSHVLDLCCGPGLLFRRCLADRDVTYLGLDLNPRFVAAVEALGGRARRFDLRETSALPEADVVVMQSSLYHFLPDAGAMVERMLGAARHRVLVSEPIRNLGASPVPWVARTARRMADPGTGAPTAYFDESSLAALFDSESLRPRVEHRGSIAGGRERLYVLRPGEQAQSR